MAGRRWGRFCAGCGREQSEGEELYEGLCRECVLSIFRVEAEKIRLPDLEVRVCKHCGEFFKGSGEPADLRSIVRDAVSRRLKAAAKGMRAELRGVDVEIEGFGRGGADAVIKFDVRFRGMELQERRPLRIKFVRRTCGRCSRISGGYYESIVQVRADGRTPRDDELVSVETIAYSALGDGPKDFISKVEPRKEGIDLYVGSIEGGRRISKSIVRALGGRISESKKLYGRKDGREVYRVTFLVRLPRFLRGDVIELDGRVILVERAEGRGVTGLDLDTGSRVFLSDEEVRRASLVGNRERAESAVLMSVIGDEIQILDPKSYETVTLKKPPFLRKKAGDDVLVVRARSGLRVLPA
ncbi:MAG: 60S ribosomal export protein NMD3 [Candidatus Alkanophagales archaeon]